MSHGPTPEEAITHLLRRVHRLQTVRLTSDLLIPEDLPSLLDIPEEIRVESEEWDSARDDVTRILYSVQLWLEVSGFPSDSLSIEEAGERLLFLHYLGLMEKGMKVLLEWPKGRLLGEPLADAGFAGDRCLGRRFRKLLVSRFSPTALRRGRRRRDQRLSAAISFSNLKKCFRPVTDRFVIQALRDHAKNLSQEDLEPDENANQIGLDSKEHQEIEAEILNTAYRIVREVIPRRFGGQVSSGDWVRSRVPAFPSGKACLEAPRRLGGFHALLRHPNPPISIAGRKIPLPTELLLMYDSPRFRRAREVRGWPFQPELPPCPLTQGAHTLERGQSGPLLRPEVQALALPIIEPLKVRVITKGEGAAYLHARQLQLFLTERLKRFRTLKSLTNGGCLEGQDLEILKDSPALLSGDYKRATDTLRATISERILTMVLDRLSGPYGPRGSLRELMISCLTGHRISYDYRSPAGLEFRESIAQGTGQLMGSFLSFPVLCLANWAANHAYLERDQGRQIPIDEAPLLVNGDDVLLGTVAKDRAIWRQYVGVIGFRESLGKSYHHPDICCINSRYFYRPNASEYWEKNLAQMPESWADAEDLPRFLRIQMWNLDRLFLTHWSRLDDPRGISVGSRSNYVDQVRLSDETIVGQLAHELMDGLPESIGQKLLTRFISRNMRGLEASGRSWGLAPVWGGLGLPVPLTKRDRDFVARCLQEPEDRRATILREIGPLPPETRVRCSEALMRERDKWWDALGIRRRIVVGNRTLGVSYAGRPVGEKDIRQLPVGPWDFLGWGAESIVPEPRSRAILRRIRRIRHWRDRLRLRPGGNTEPASEEVCRLARIGYYHL